MREKSIKYIDKSNVPSLLKSPIDYRKSGLSINHIIGCSLECSYCIRNDLDNYDMKEPSIFMDDKEVVSQLLKHKYFQQTITPIQVFNRATDPFLPTVKKHTFNILNLLNKNLDNNHVLIITRYRITEEDAKKLNNYTNIKLTILVTYSGIEDKTVEPVSSKIAVSSLKTMYKHSLNYKIILYWRPIIAGVNNRIKDIDEVIKVSKFAHATVFSGLFYRDSIRDNFRINSIPTPYTKSARRKILPLVIESDLVEYFLERSRGLFRKTSCAVAYVHGVHDYNGHYGIKEICDICPESQKKICSSNFKKPTTKLIANQCNKIEVSSSYKLYDSHMVFDDLGESDRYFLQHSLGFQVHDRKHPHLLNRHGKAPIETWSTGLNNGKK